MFDSRLCQILAQGHARPISVQGEELHTCWCRQGNGTQGVLAKSLILMFYGGTQPQALEYQQRKSSAYYINYSVGK